VAKGGIGGVDLAVVIAVQIRECRKSIGGLAAIGYPRLVAE
jgi:hypothetical protein